MVARTPLKQKRVVAPLNPLLLRETLKKVDKCMARLQEMQYTVAGGNKVISGVSLSPRSTRGYLKTSLRCKQESLRIKSSTGKSPNGKFPTNGEWKNMSLPAMLVGETVGEILEATQFARDIVAAVSNRTQKTSQEDPKTPETEQRKQRPNPENTELRSRRKREKQNKLQSIRSESSNSPSLQRARSRINFKVVSPLKVKDLEKENTKFLANRVSPRNKPWTKKTVLFPNPLFQSTQSTQEQRFCKTRSPVIPRNKGTPHKFLIKSPAKVQVKIRSPPAAKVISPKMSSAAKLRRSFSPSRLANRLMSPLKSRRMSLDKGGGSMSGLKQRPQAMPMRFSIGRMQGL